MIYADLPPKLWTPPKPAIIRAAEPWQIEANQKLVELGIPRNVRRSVLLELKRLQSAREGLDDLAKWAKVDSTKFASIHHLFLMAYGNTAAAKGASFLSVQSDDTGPKTSFSFSSVSTGTADANRYIVLAMGAQRFVGSSTTVSSFTLGGASVTQVVYRNTNQPSGIYIIAQPTGTSATIAITFNVNQQSCAIGVYRVILPAGSSSFATLSAGYASNQITGTINVPSDGVLIACDSLYTAGNSVTTTWTGLTKQYDLFPTLGALSGGFASGLSSQTGRTVTAALTSGTSEGGMVAASW